MSKEKIKFYLEGVEKDIDRLSSQLPTLYHANYTKDSKVIKQYDEVIKQINGLEYYRSDLISQLNQLIK